ncbi:MAG: hypothetical protein JSS04_00795 [Proteobacteria bacterium]|nr:hypothetical protein [Pseudomonadota bacterium]
MTRAGAIGLAAAALAVMGGCTSIGPATVPRDRSDYGAAIGDSWKQQTLLNIVKLRYADFPVFLEVGQVIAGYQVQTTISAGVAAQNYITTAVGGPAAVAGTAGASGTYIDRPTVMYAPLTGTDFIKKLMSPIPPSAVLFLLQSGYSATVVMEIAVDSINGIANESRRPGLKRPADPRFERLGQLLYELQLANAFQIRIERGKDSAESSVVSFPPAVPSAEIAAKIDELRSILRLSGHTRSYPVYYGGGPGKGDEISLTTRSMLQIMLELGLLAQVPEADIVAGRAAPGGSTARQEEGSAPLLNILSGPAPPADAYVAVPYKGRWFWIADTDFRSKSIFGAVMLLFSISDVGVRSAPPVVTVPAN